MPLYAPHPLRDGSADDGHVGARHAGAQRVSQCSMSPEAPGLNVRVDL